MLRILTFLRRLERVGYDKARQEQKCRDGGGEHGGNHAALQRGIASNTIQVYEKQDGSGNSVFIIDSVAFIVPCTDGTHGSNLEMPKRALEALSMWFDAN